MSSSDMGNDPRSAGAAIIAAQAGELSALHAELAALRADNARLKDRIEALTTEMDGSLSLRMKIKRMDEVVAAARACTVWEDRETFEAMRAATCEYDAAEEALAVHRPGGGKT